MTRRGEAVVEVLADPERPRRDWSARTRLNAVDLLRYTRIVSVMKRALPAAAFVVIATVIAFFFVQRQPRRVEMAYERLGHVENDLAMLKPRLSGADEKGNPFVITADAAIEDPNNLKRAQLKNVQADLALDKTDWIDASAAEGVVDMRAGTLNLDGGISMFSDSGYELHTAKANVDLHAGILRGPGSVIGHGPLGQFTADRFEADRAQGRLILNGNVHMTIERKARS